ncbi:MAG: hypothetical protein QXE84_02500 [Candidatus Nitrosotenuis sp.]
MHLEIYDDIPKTDEKSMQLVNNITCIVLLSISLLVVSVNHVEAVTGDYMPPLKQFKSGIKVENVTCQNNLQLIFKATNGYPACVKASSVSKLLTRGWGYDISATSQPIPKDLTNMDK